MNIVEVKKVGFDKVEVKVNKGTEITVLKRTVRKHNKETRELAKKGIYCFEIQGVLYWYNVQKGTNVMVQYKEPEDFRSEDRTTDELKKQGRKSVLKDEENSISVKAPKQKKETKKEEPKKEEKKEEQKQEIFTDGEVFHKEYETIKQCINLDIPVFLVGEAGTGKNHTLEQIAFWEEYDFYFTNSVQQEYKLTGFIDAGGKYHETEFYKAFTKGGIFFLDEMDASIPEVLVLLNAAIANKYFEFPCGMKTAHPKFRVVAAGNTVGSGADEKYTGRMILDQATLDRFVTIDFDYDRNIELSLTKGNTELVDFVESLRKNAKENGIRATFSYRCLQQVTKLENVLPLEKVLQISVFKGMDIDTINTFRNDSSNNKYYKAMKGIH